MSEKIPEKVLLAEILRYLAEQGHYCWRNNSGAVKMSYKTKAGMVHNRFWKAGMKGSSDILGVAKDGRFIAIETKIKPNKPTEAQEYFLQRIRENNGYALCAYCLEDVSKYL